MNKLIKILKISLTIIICTLIIFYLILEIIIPKTVEINLNWDIINSVTQIFMAIATFAAVFVALEPSKRKIAIHFYMKYHRFEDASLYMSKPKIFITNPSNKVIIIHKIIISAKKVDFINIKSLSLDVMYLDLLSDESDRPIILTIDNKEFIKGQPIIIIPNQTVELALSPHTLQHSFGHYIDTPNYSNKDWTIRIELTDINKKKHKLKTKITFEEYHNNLISIIEDSYN